MFPLSQWGDCIDTLLFIIIGYIGIRLSLSANTDILNDGENIDEMSKMIFLMEDNFYILDKMNICNYYNNLGWLNFEKLSKLLLS